MSKRFTLILIAMMIACSLFGLVLLACTVSPPPAEDWSTDNEDPCCPGDWHSTVTWGSSYITRVDTYAYEGSYSYLHYVDQIATSRLYCSTPITQGVFDANILFPEDSGHGGSDNYWVLGLGHYISYGYTGGWSIFWNFFAKRMGFYCTACNPNIGRWLGSPRPGEWHNYRVEWNLPPDPGTGSFTVYMDGVEWVNESGVPMDNGGDFYWGIHWAGAGPFQWHATWGRPRYVYVDDVEIYPCDEPWPSPTATPAGGDAWQYGHAAVINVDDDCEGVLRFRTIPSYIPGGATVTRATLRIYGVAAEVPGEWVYVTPLNAVWGEATTDWCRRLVGTGWVIPGATSVPEDREPGSIAVFQTALGWIDIDLPVGLVENWALTGEANPGLILWNPNLTGKFSVASREWHVEDYQPRINVWYTE